MVNGQIKFEFLSLLNLSEKFEFNLTNISVSKILTDFLNLNNFRAKFQNFNGFLEDLRFNSIKFSSQKLPTVSYSFKYTYNSTDSSNSNQNNFFFILSRCPTGSHKNYFIYLIFFPPFRSIVHLFLVENFFYDFYSFIYGSMWKDNNVPFFSVHSVNAILFYVLILLDLKLYGDLKIIYIFFIFFLVIYST